MFYNHCEHSFKSDEAEDNYYAELRKEELARKEFRKQRSKEIGKSRIFRKFKRRQVNNPIDK